MNKEKRLLMPNLLALVIILLSTAPAPSAGDQSFCGDATYKRNGTYMSNLRTLADALIGDAARLHSATGAAGEGPDRVYGAALCRADSAGADCARRLRDALGAIDGGSTSGDASCALRRDVAVYSELYQLRFSGRDFLADFSNAPEWADVTNPDAVPHDVAARFDERVTELLTALADTAARRPDRWAVGKAPWPSLWAGDTDRAVYGLAQCTQDMPPDRCRACLGGVVAERRRKIGGRKMGGAVFGARCTMRYEMDLQFFNVTGNSKMLSLRQKKDRAFIIIAAVYSSAVLCTRLFFWLLSVWRKEKRRKMNSMEEPKNIDEVLRLWRLEDTSSEFSLYDFSQIADATDNFSTENKLGEGGFGPVYKGVFPDGQDLAIKRLSARSRQGLLEFKNEIQVIAKLQHRNLVRLLGCCIHEEEKMLIYEYLPNKSLDHFIFDPIRGASLKWKRRIKIVEGIAQGLLYLHNHSRLRIIHRDLKASNILLDSQLNPKISDFGMARIFPSDATQVTASRLVGTFGYMAPEYASGGLLSIKSDVFSFGVLLLEIISGKRSSGFQYNGEFYNLLEYAWQLWKGRRWNEFTNQSFDDEYEPEELMKYLVVALMCVQEKTIDRPIMADVVAILSSDGITLPEPKQPAYSYAKLDVSVNATVLSSRNDIADATDNFSTENKLGEGGFGPVYKGVFPDGQDLAIKRLSARSRQGLLEFKNEIQVIAKLQHRNLVRLLGCCIHEEEKMLIYEYLPNKSLDHFIFDPIRGASLKWKRRIKIVEGIAQGLLYLHNHSRLRIIHRDLKASNILLDSQLNPKISDFGMARIFPSDATQVTASRLVGTFGYMAPEYASGGLLSIKSDVFSFGVLLLEIISGKRSSGFQYNGEFYNLLEYAWQLWKGRRWNEFTNQSFDDEYEPEELMKYLVVALMCVQEKTIDRPIMADVVAILSSDGITLPEPKQPAYSYAKLDVSVNATVLSSRNDIADATDNFSTENKLGEGGFGPVYKGVFPDGQDLAIKRLSARSRQGLLEFKNEIQVIAKLQHRNLVRLLGCCIHEEEKMLIYEYLPNKSLDHFIFDPIRGASLKWKRRIKIVEGIAQGLLYLHNHSRLRIIHRDLKASNILLDSQLNPKISDFGMARIFPSDATQVTASRLVGTFGYMAPEYASGGLLSIKSDVFSFGVLLLEIISGKRSSGFQYNGEFYNLLEYAWQLWKGRRWNEFTNQSFDDEYEPEELMKYLVVALMCVQEKTIDRPIMADVVAILSSDGITLPEPKQPAYSYAKLDVSVNATVLSSRNDVSITTTNGR